MKRSHLLSSIVDSEPTRTVSTAFVLWVLLVPLLAGACGGVLEEENDDSSPQPGLTPTATPAAATTAPGDDDTTPGDDDTATGDDDTAPGDDDSSPGSTPTPPSDSTPSGTTPTPGPGGTTPPAGSPTPTGPTPTPAPGPALGFDALELDFGTVLLGDTGEDYITLTNIGDATLQLYWLAPESETAFAVAAGTPFSPGVTVPPGSSLTFGIEFTPDAEGLYEDDLSIISNDPDSPHLVPLSGHGKDGDLDNDGFNAQSVGGDDCNDASASVHPGASETPYDGIDQDCSGADLTDVDSDGHAGEQAGGDDCADLDSAVYPGATENCDGADNDCSGEVDDDPSGSCGTGGLPDTGQTKCYSEAGKEITCGSSVTVPGQDAESISVCIPTYTDNGDGTVTDACTGLVWQAVYDFSLEDWDNALRYCDGLSLGGASDWRLPNIRELQSLALYGPTPALDGTYFAGTSGPFWSSTTREENNKVWMMDFSKGNLTSQYPGMSGETAFRRCVRGTSPTLPETGQTTCWNMQGKSITCGSDPQVPAQDAQFASGCTPGFTNNADGTLTDNCTGLVWQEGEDGKIRDWDDALRVCDALDIGGRRDWRLPNIRELVSLLRYNPLNPLYDTAAFPAGRSGSYWTSTSDNGSAEKAWILHFGNGLTSVAVKLSTSESTYSRCVHRGGTVTSCDDLEIPYDGIDQDCDGSDLIDVDGDGYPATEAGGTDCDDNVASYYPGALERCNGDDDDCDFMVDEDPSGAPLCIGGLPDTGLELCYAAGEGQITCGSDPNVPGQDAEWDTGCAPSYTVHSDGTVTDNCTGLVWQQVIDYSYEDWDNALRYCDALSLGGATDWRLPSVRELQSIALYDADGNGAIEETAFTGYLQNPYWTSTTRSDGGSQYVILIHFIDGGMWYYKYNQGGETAARRCVRGISATLPESYQTQCYNYSGQKITCGSDPQVPGQDAELVTGCISTYLDNDNGTVTDSCTGITWQQTEDFVTRDWDDALRYCDGLSLAGQSDWRLPNARELLSIGRWDLYNPSASTTAFPGVRSSKYWSSTGGYTNSGAWMVNFYNSALSLEVKQTPAYVRCARGG